ncbi:hypothetical protein C9374_010515 [Naegleria lovaniensis]|uniref:Uncharacterized protein n=1 Tax=Naegleria lovaniensis TaxID=51637 RepID=A0AA88GDZ2_NAELO|nr:uncharacterized protein C9374_010515 [Naegleria lovaniensis]KAG2374771.1 hypothetical protein C9374_010515 [Naegleria lovaniensis]
MERCKTDFPQCTVSQVRLDGSGMLEVYLFPSHVQIPECIWGSESSHSSSKFKPVEEYRVYDGYLFEFYSSGESPSEKKAKAKMQLLVANNASVSHEK